MLLLAAFLLTVACNASVELERRVFSNDDTTLPYRIYIPSEVADGDTHCPVVVFLHGAGERGDNNEDQLKNAINTLFERNDGLMKGAIVIVPQCPEGNMWVDTPWENGNYSTDEISESNELAAVCELTDEICKTYNADRDRVYAIGISMGGFGVWDLIVRHNDIFAAAMPICGGGDPSKASLLVDTPIFTFHGTADPSVPYEGTEEMVSAIEDCGGRSIVFYSYENAGHGIWDEACAEPDVLEWLFSAKLSDRYPAEAEVSAPTISDTETSELDDTSGSQTTSEPSEESYEPSSENAEDSAGAVSSAAASEEIGDDVGEISDLAVIIIILAVTLALAAVTVTVKLRKKK